ncbi:MAG: alanine--tRNA ligase [Planctomycetes bacterium]|nr:alanine--tRNA ligase [Planctomycetota bacterium]MCH9727982.1 alanine--tRNA ligase [Planctomycetota bacterium]MCH9775784.1 alanine--tRNA ligase [Planctomycetota bacterium]MCH9790608.1 alanine--tRNA ligase [Planctomycetota bacterium]
MNTDELRECYLSFFEEKGCIRRPSDVLVPRDDRTVLFTPAGMNQFKNQFLGVGKLDFTRATTCQMCLRTGDIQNVGVTAYHHTFFEMLGNFSFGDYFKRDAIHWAWEYLTDKKWLGLDPNLLSVTVYQEDDEAYNIWHDDIKLPANRISRENEHENFWPAGAPSLGPDGVCGPCSEIFYHPNGGKDNVEIWNLVFTQFNRVGDPPDNLQPLPKKNIDTGMGLERTAAVLQGVQSNFEIDTLKQLCLAAADTVGTEYQFEKPTGRPIRRISDHIRAITFSIHEGVNPGSEKESYVVRQLLRRALLEGYLLGKHDPFLYQLVPAVVDIMKTPYPDIAKTVENVQRTIKEEEQQFLSVIEKGLNRFEGFLKNAEKQGLSEISGEDAFDLHQTDGFLIELTEALAAKNNISVDRTEFNTLMKRHKEGSGSGAFLDSVMSEGPLTALHKTTSDTVFRGYDSTEAEGKVVGIIAEDRLVESMVEKGHAHPVVVVLDQSPFYAEAGGQVGDMGFIEAEGVKFEVINTQKNGGLTLHIGHLLNGKLEQGQTVNATVISPRRSGIERAHSATHLLHHALRTVLGENAMQRGSKVEEDMLRFDFSHRKAVTPDEVSQIEDIINQRISEGASISTELMKLQKARDLGAMALFGEKYPDNVRVVQMGDFSIELCGGTHLSNTGQVGLCKIVNEEPVAKGVRRIHALTGSKALEKTRHTEKLLQEIAAQLKVPRPDELPQRILHMQEELRETKKKLLKYSSKSLAGTADELLQTTKSINDVKIVAYHAQDASRDQLRELADHLRKKGKQVALILGTVIDGKVALMAAVNQDLIKQGLKAGDCVKVAAKVVGGGGGGRPDMAEAGGKHPEKLDEALSAGADYYRSQLES